MTRAQMLPDQVPAFTVATLAAKWQCGQSTVRKLIDRGELTAFRIGTGIRISAEEVGRYECHNTRCSDSVADTPLSGETSTEHAADERSTPKIGRARRPRRGRNGKAGTVLHGPWAD
jgi:excisionase family DNA binding protein